MEIRLMTENDYSPVYRLWQSTAGLGLNPADDSPQGIHRYLARNPSTCFVAEESGQVIGAILAGHDGRRGYLYHLAVAEPYRRQGLARRLVEEALAALRGQGIRKAALVAFRDNEPGNAFWESAGFSLREDLSYRNRLL